MGYVKVSPWLSRSWRCMLPFSLGMLHPSGVPGCCPASGRRPRCRTESQLKLGDGSTHDNNTIAELPVLRESDMSASTVSNFYLAAVAEQGAGEAAGGPEGRLQDQVAAGAQIPDRHDQGAPIVRAPSQSTVPILDAGSFQSGAYAVDSGSTCQSCREALRPLRPCPKHMHTRHRRAGLMLKLEPCPAASPASPWTRSRP